MGIKYGTENSISLLNKDTKSITIGGYTFEYDKVYRYDRPENQIIAPELQLSIKDQLINFILFSGAVDSNGPNFATKDYILPDDFDWNWNLTGKDKYGLQGSLTKRISNYYFKKFKIKISADVMSIIGNKLNKELTSEATVYFDMTNNLERGRDYFYNGSSCWFGSASNGRYFLMDFGGGAIRLLSDEKEGSFPVGRCWFCPILDGKALVLFNEYGQAGLFSYARMLANISGLSYKRIVLHDTGDLVYLNHYDNNYIIGPVDIISDSDYNLPYPKVKSDYHSYVCTKCARYYSRNRILANTVDTYYYQGLCVNCGVE